MKADKAAVAKEAAEKVDVTGLTPMQAWAEKQRAMRQAGAAPKRAKRATRRVRLSLAEHRCLADAARHTSIRPHCQFAGSLLTGWLYVAVQRGRQMHSNISVPCSLCMHQASAARKELGEEAAAPPAPPAAARHAATAGNGGTLMNERGTAVTAQPQPQRAQESEVPDQAPPAEAHACGGATLDNLEQSSEEEVAEAANDDVSISSSSSSEPDHAEEDEEEAGSEDLTGDVLDLARDEGPSQVPDTQPRASQVRGHHARADGPPYVACHACMHAWCSRRQREYCQVHFGRNCLCSRVEWEQGQQVCMTCVRGGAKSTGLSEGVPPGASRRRRARRWACWAACAARSRTASAGSPAAASAAASWPPCRVRPTESNSTA